MIPVPEIARRPDLRSAISLEAAHLINELLFDIPDAMSDPCEAVVIFGSVYPENRGQIASTFREVHASLNPRVVFITGGVTRDGAIPESEGILSALGPEKYPQVEFRLDRTSTNTLDNVLRARDLGLAEFEEIFFVAIAPHCGRCKLTLAQHLPGKKIRHRGYLDAIYADGLRITRDTWHLEPETSKLVWGEVLRIEKYGTRGDIAYPAEIAKKITRIKSLVC